MLVIMAGPPASGKTSFVEALKTKLAQYTVKIVDPSHDLPPDFDSYDDQLQKDYRVAAFNVCLEYSRALMLEPPDTIIIHDTCASKFLGFQPLIADAMVHKHQIAFVFVTANKTECQERMGSKWVEDEQFDRYIQDFKMSVPEFKEVSNYKAVVKNTGSSGRDNLETAAQQLAAFITAGAGRVLQPDHTASKVTGA